LNKHIVYGNGESRPRQPIEGNNFITWGCNAIYRDFPLDNLVSIDYPMQQEIYESDYPLTHKCWFADWEVLPPFFEPESLMMNWNDPIYQTPKRGRSSCVVQGKTKETVEANIKEAIQQNPDLDVEDLRRKAEKDVGLYITWVDEYNDKVINIDYPKDWSTGNTALYLACKYGAKEIYMLGFDGNDYNKPINNVYKGSSNYLPENNRGFNPVNWNNQFRMLQRDFPNVQFYRVGTDLTYDELYKNIR